MRLATALFPAIALAAALAGCGGGGGGDSSGNADAAPTSGPYTWVLKAQGPTTSLTYGLSLVSPGKRGTEYMVEYGSSVLTDTRVVSAGSSQNPAAASNAAHSSLLFIRPSLSCSQLHR